ncbi:MAG: M12 family metallo-peptidase [Phycisphaerales bacterium]|nr:M12 family metallo-peptidase [Phycisphaerales bacterium]
MLFTTALATIILVAPVAPEASPSHLREILKQSDAQSLQSSLALPGGAQLELDLERFEVLAEGAEVIVQDSTGTRPADLGGLQLWRGRVKGDPDSRFFMAISRHFTEGYIQCSEGMFLMGTGPGGKHPFEIFDTASMPEHVLEVPACEIRTVDGLPPRPVDATAFRGIDTDPDPCRVTQIAIETDWEFAQRLYDGDADAAATYAVTLTGGVSEIYQDDINLRYSITFLRTWGEDIDPYDPDSSTDMLDQFRNHWNSQMTGIDRTIAHIITGRTNLPYGGVAYVSVLCNQNYGYGVSGYIEGYFPYPLQDNVGSNWDLVVMAHELGHNHGTLHTHDGYTPPIDNCGNGDCTGAENGTIMSYCHTCSGGISNIELGFHPLVQGAMLSYMEGLEPGCDLQVVEAGTALDDAVVTLPGEAIDIDVLANDRLTGCDGTFIPVIDTFDAFSLEGGTIEVVDGTDLLRYQPATGFGGLDSFSYLLTMGDSAVVTVDVATLRAPDSVISPVPGASVGYYDLPALSELPDFSTLEPFDDDVVDLIEFASTGGEFINSGLSDDVGAVFEGYIDVPASGYWTLHTESDDGSKLYIGDVEVVDNDGLHGMQERSGEIGLLAGTHAIRVEFFERGGGAGLIVRWQGPGIGKQVIPASNWSYETSDCPGDTNGDLVIDVSDVLGIIDNWGCEGCPEDVDGSGFVETNDLLLVLSVWNENC